MTEILYEALECFSVMTENDDVNDSVAYKYIQKKYGKDIAESVIRLIGKK